jgi:hypothetical protein
VVAVPIDATDLVYVMSKYNESQAGALVWYVANIDGSVAFPLTWGGHDISHQIGVGVSDGAVTLVLLSGALVGLEALRRRFRA